MAVVTSSLTGALVASHRSKRFHLAGCGTILRRLRHAVLIRAAGRTQWAKFETIAHSLIDLCANRAVRLAATPSPRRGSLHQGRGYFGQSYSGVPCRGGVIGPFD